MARRMPLLAGLVLCLLVGLAGPAAAGPWVDRAAGSLRDDPLYVNASARPTLTPAEAEQVRARLAIAGTPVFVAVLPGRARGEAGGDVNQLAALVAASVGRPGTYLVVAGGEEGAASDAVARGAAASQARAAFRRHPEPAAATMDFIGRVEHAAGRPPATTSPPQPPPGQQDTDGNTVLVVLLAIAGVVTVAVLLALTLENRSERRSIRSRTELSEAKAVSQEDLTALADDLRNLDVNLHADEATGNPQAVSQYTRAYEYLERAEQEFEQAKAPGDLARVSSALESGRFAMASARAQFERHDPPRRRPPCFFDTRHGPSVNDVGWEAPDGSPRPVPVCAACMAQIASGVQPQPRKVRSGLHRVPFYELPPHFESWFGGYFGGAAADLVAGFPLGNALDDGFVGGRNTSGGGYGYLPVSYADTGVLDSGGAITGERESDSGTITIQEDPDEDQ